MGTDYDTNHPPPEPQLSPQPHEKEQLVKPNQHEWGWR